MSRFNLLDLIHLYFNSWNAQINFYILFFCVLLLLFHYSCVRNKVSWLISFSFSGLRKMYSTLPVNSTTVSDTCKNTTPYFLFSAFGILICFYWNFSYLPGLLNRKYEREASLCAIFRISSSDCILVHYVSLVSDSLTIFFITNCSV